MAYTRPTHAHPQAVGHVSIRYRSPEYRLIEEVLKDIYADDITGTTYELVKLGHTLDFIVSGKMIIRHLRNKGGELLRVEMGIVFHYEIKESDVVSNTFSFPHCHGADYEVDDGFSLAIFGEDNELIVAIYGNHANSPTLALRDAVASHYHQEMLCAQHLYRAWQDSGIPQRLKSIETQLRSRALDQALEKFSIEALDREVARVFGDDLFEDPPAEGAAPEDATC